MAILGAHMSIAGGYWKAVVAARQAGCNCVQIFTKNNNQWCAKPISDEDVDRFQAALAEHEISHPLSHASYLINLASPKIDLREKSIDAMVVELERGDQLGIPDVVFHPAHLQPAANRRGWMQSLHRWTPLMSELTNWIRRCCWKTRPGKAATLVGISNIFATSSPVSIRAIELGFALIPATLSPPAIHWLRKLNLMQRLRS